MSKGREYTYWMAVLRPADGPLVRKTFPHTDKGLVRAHDWLGEQLTLAEAEEALLAPLEPLPDPKPMEPSPSLWEAVRRLAVAGQYWEASRVAFVGARCLAAQCRDCG